MKNKNLWLISGLAVVGVIAYIHNKKKDGIAGLTLMQSVMPDNPSNYDLPVIGASVGLRPSSIKWNKAL